MKYKEIVKGEFVSRPNRFIANVIVDGETEVVHVKNTGRCKELLVPGATVFLSVGNNPVRKTKYDLVAVIKQRSQGDLLINMDSQIPNYVVDEWLKKGNIFSKNAKIKREFTYNNSRFDFFVEDEGKKAFVEVKGVTLENDGVASFPDAPTLRGIKHINELITAVNEGYDAYIIFVIQMKGIDFFKPDSNIHKDFADALERAEKSGVNIIAVDCDVTENSLNISQEIPVYLT